MKLIRDGDTKNNEGNSQGVYILGEKLVNSYPYWYQQNGSNALWFVKTYRIWMVGPKIHLGQTIGGIIGPRGIDRSPTRIVNGWKYYANGIWKDAASSEIMFKDLTPGMYFFAVVFHYQTINFHISKWLMISVK